MFLSLLDCTYNNVNSHTKNTKRKKIPIPYLSFNFYIDNFNQIPYLHFIFLLTDRYSSEAVVIYNICLENERLKDQVSLDFQTGQATAGASDFEQLFHMYIIRLLFSYRVCSGHLHVAWIKLAIKLCYKSRLNSEFMHRTPMILVNTAIRQSLQKCFFILHR